jgi:oxygen-independent coproporphyrinogen-3 oxidase
VLDEARLQLGLAPDAELTLEANPESVTPASLAGFRAAGLTRLSLGMQSAVPHVLAVLDRTHTPGRPVAAAREARAAGFEQVSLDLIYGTPGERLVDWQASLDAALEAEPDHLSAYALIVEDGTRLAAQIRRGELPAPDEDLAADCYLLAEDRLVAAGLRWYEVSNWARSPDTRCRHHLGYWGEADWWGIGPGAHSHVGGTRWWNVKHPAMWAGHLLAGRSPAAGREVLTPAQRSFERVMLGIRTVEGVATADLDPAGLASTAGLAGDGLVDAAALAAGRVVLTLQGRLLADLVARRLLPDLDA